MALQTTFTQKGKTYTDSYHKISKIEMDRSQKFVRLDISIYANKAFRDSELTNEGLSNPMFTTFIVVDKEDFDLFFNSSVYIDGKDYHESNGYDFLKTVCPTEAGSKYSSFLYDYKNNTIDI